jgi:hypothetical protein
MNNFLWLNPTDGISQDERLINSLLPENIKIDDKTNNEIISFITGFARLLTYYNHNDKADGDWYRFLINDTSVFLTLLSSFYPIEKKKIDEISFILNETRDIDTTHKQLYIYCDAIIEFAKKITAFYKDYYLLKKKSLSTGLDEKMVQNTLINELENAENKLTEKIREIKTKRSEFFTTTNIEELKDQRNSIEKSLQEIFNTYNSIQSFAIISLQNIAPPAGNNMPHISMLKTFAHLYGHLQQQINELPKRHLNFYYNQFLNIKAAPAVPDKVHVFFNPATTGQQVLIDKGEILIAEDVSNNGKPIKYRTTQGLLVTNAKIEKIHTLFISNYTRKANFKTNAGLQDIIDAKVFKASHPVINPEDFSSPYTTPAAWPVLGEDQLVKENSKINMQPADIGFALSSPLFYQPEGNRSFKVIFHLSVQSLNKLNDYIENFAKVYAKNISIAMHELLHESFLLKYTAPDGWQPVLDTTIRLSVNEQGLCFSFDLLSSNKQFSIYTPKIHGGNFNPGWPLLMFFENKNTPYTAFTFLSNLAIERITVRVVTEGQSTFHLQNNIGVLSTASPFQPFGPQPVISSYLQIKNSNIFNRFTNNFTLHIKWLNLPQQTNGFDDYYAAYNAKINNDSYKITISNAANSTQAKTTTNNAAFNLFNTFTNNGNQLSNTTVIKNVLANTLCFNNNMQLNHPEDNSFAGSNSGAVKLTLAAPADAFGHSLYATLLPRVLLQNSKKNIKRHLPVPQPPYTPVIQSITCDYTLEHTETLSNWASHVNPANHFTFYHLYPFGFKQAYPTPTSNNVLLLPAPSANGSLMIGLKNVKANEELTLLFQLGKSKPSSSAYNPEEIAWSYLQNDNWIFFNKEHILSDTTNHLIKTGIVKLRLPTTAQQKDTSTIVNPDYFWIRASLQKPSKLNSCILGIFTHAVEAERLLTETETAPSRQLVLPPGSIKRFEKKIGGIQKIWQPFHSYSGKAEETTNHYYLRVSERLYHRNRAQTALDIAEILLEKFPDIYLVKTVMRGKGPYYGPYPADITLVLFPKLSETERATTEEPSIPLAILCEVEEYMKKMLPAFVTIQVKNPVYERVKVFCEIKFGDNGPINQGLFEKRLTTDIQKYICPWMFDDKEHVAIGTQTIYIQDLLKYLKNLPYVKDADNLSILHFYQVQVGTNFYWAINETGVKKISGIIASGPESILIPSTSHIFTAAPKTTDEVPSPIGIGSLLTGIELATNGFKIHNENKKYGISDEISEDFTDDEDENENFTFTIQA